jgi:hypothetical protein
MGLKGKRLSRREEYICFIGKHIYPRHGTGALSYALFETEKPSVMRVRALKHRLDISHSSYQTDIVSKVNFYSGRDWAC